MNGGMVPSRLLPRTNQSGRLRPRLRSPISPPAGLHPLSPEEETQARVEMTASDEPAFDWSGAVAACTDLTRQGWMARAKFVTPWDRWVVEARQKGWPLDQWGTLRKDGRVRQRRVA